MPVVALVVTLAEEPALAQAARERLAGDARLCCGPPFGARLPLVVSCDDGQESAVLLDEIEATSGVRFVELVMADYDDVAAQGGCS